MKIINKSKLTELTRNYVVIFAITYIVIVSTMLFTESYASVFLSSMVPKLIGVGAYDLSLFVLILLFTIAFVAFSINVYKILAFEHFRIIDSYVEGPNEKGERVVISKNQIVDIGLDLFGQFAIFTNEHTLVLPGKLDLKEERELKRKLKNELKY